MLRLVTLLVMVGGLSGCSSSGPVECSDKRILAEMVKNARAQFIRVTDHRAQTDPEPTASIMREFLPVLQNGSFDVVDVQELSWSEPSKTRECRAYLEVKWDEHKLRDVANLVVKQNSDQVVGTIVSEIQSMLSQGDRTEIVYSVSLNSEGSSVVREGAESFVVN